MDRERTQPADNRSADRLGASGLREEDGSLTLKHPSGARLEPGGSLELRHRRFGESMLVLFSLVLLSRLGVKFRRHSPDRPAIVRSKVARDIAIRASPCRRKYAPLTIDANPLKRALTR
jgi:hypothetical protein